MDAVEDLVGDDALFKERLEFLRGGEGKKKKKTSRVSGQPGQRGERGGVHVRS